MQDERPPALVGIERLDRSRDLVCATEPLDAPLVDSHQHPAEHHGGKAPRQVLPC